jgi:GntR family transcriptional regulator
MAITKLRGDSRPLYAQTVDVLYALIQDGTFHAGAPLPAAEVLADQLGVSRSTLREAISYLEMDGLLVRRQGVGTYVAATPGAQVRGGLERLRSFRELAKMAGRRVVEDLDRKVHLVPAGERESHALRLDSGAELVRVQVVEAIEGCRMAYLDSVAPCVPDLVDLETLNAAEGSLLDYLVDYTDVPLAYTRSSLYAIDADEVLASHLQVGSGRSLLHLAETLYTEKGQPVAMSLNYFITDCFSFTINRRIERERRSTDRRVPGQRRPGRNAG